MDGREGDAMGELLRVLAGAALVAACVTGASAADPDPGRAERAPVARKSREELMREWDLNADGRIDEGEVEVASSRMRLERAQLRLNSGIDPVTGLPRDFSGFDALPDDDADAAVGGEDPPADPEPAEADTDTDRDGAKPLPGSRVPRPKLPFPRVAGPSQRAQESPADSGSRAAADLKRQPVMGGVRGGGIPARGGYGAGLPAAPLNAGLPIPPKTRPETTPRPRGGLVPALRPATPSPQPRPGGSRELFDPY